MLACEKLALSLSFAAALSVASIAGAQGQADDEPWSSSDGNTSCLGDRAQAEAAMQELALNFACAHLDEASCSTLAGIPESRTRAPLSADDVPRELGVGAVVAGAAAVGANQRSLPGDPALCNVRQVGALRLLLPDAEAKGCISVAEFLAQHPSAAVHSSLGEARSTLAARQAELESALAAPQPEGLPASASGRDMEARRLQELTQERDRLRAGFEAEQARVEAHRAAARPVQWDRIWAEVVAKNPNDASSPVFSRVGRLFDRLKGMDPQEAAESAQYDVRGEARGNLPPAVADEVVAKIDRGLAQERQDLRISEDLRKAATEAESRLQAAEQALTSQETRVGLLERRRQLDQMRAELAKTRSSLAQIATAQGRFNIEMANAGTDPQKRLAAATRAAEALQKAAPGVPAASALIMRVGGATAVQAGASEAQRTAASLTLQSALEAIKSGMGKAAASKGARMAGMAVLAVIAGKSIPGATAAELVQEAMRSDGIPCSQWAHDYFSWDRGSCVANPGTTEQTAAFLKLDADQRYEILVRDRAACAGVKNLIQIYDRRGWRAQCGDQQLRLTRTGPKSDRPQTIQIEDYLFRALASGDGANARIEYSGGREAGRRCSDVVFSADESPKSAQFFRGVGVRGNDCLGMDKGRFGRIVRLGGQPERSLPSLASSAERLADTQEAEPVAQAIAGLTRARLEAQACCAGSYDDCSVCSAYGVACRSSQREGPTAQ